MASTAPLSFAQTGQRDWVVRVGRRATMHESPSLQEFADAAFQRDPGCSVIVDLSNCEYLDSTFLGTLLSLQRRSGTQDRFLLAVSPERSARLLKPPALRRFLRTVSEPPACETAWATLPESSFGQRELAQHVARCHRRLSEQLEGPEAERFREVADRLDWELHGEAER